MDLAREESALVALLRGSELRPAMKPAELRVSLHGAMPSELLAESGDLISDFETELSSTAQLIAAWRSAGLEVRSYLDPAYPTPFLEAYDSPLVAFLRGHSAPDRMTVAIVGSREPGDHAASAARSIARSLAADGVTVVSGLARGIDTQAHLGALDVGGRTVAVLGHGLSSATYPKENAGLLERIVENGGHALSQFWPDSRPTKISFPMRNVTMSAYSRATVILAAGEKSGTRHQANAAVHHGRALLLHRAVAEGTSWGKELEQRGLAQRFRSASEAMELVAAVRDAVEGRVDVFA